MAEVLRSQPAKSYEFHKAPLRDVLRMLADDAGISFVSLTEDSEEAKEPLVTFTMKTSPFKALEVIAKSNGVALFYEDGIWYLRPFNDQELVARSYKIKYNTQEEVKYDNQAVGSVGISSSSSSVGTSSSTGGGGLGQSSGSPDIGLSLNGVTDIFNIKNTDGEDGKIATIVREVKALIGIPTTSFEAPILPARAVDSTAPTSVQPRSADTQGKGSSAKPAQQVLWNSNTNTLYVVATRQQHGWVEGYLTSIDKPQPLIAIEVKFLETTKDPRKQLGLDWTGTLGEGYEVKLSDIKADVHMDQLINPASAVGPAVVAGTAVLSADDVAVTLRAFLNDRDSSTVSYPRVLTRNNREVVIRSVINQPVMAAQSTVTPGVGGTSSSQIIYLPIGTIINVLPKVMADGSVSLTAAVIVSSIVSQERIEANLYPVVSARIYYAALDVKSTYTLAVGGLEEAFDASLKTGIPLLKDIPILGELFKSNDRSQRKKNLMMFITPTILDPGTTVGISEKPESVVPQLPSNPKPPAFTPDGMLVGGSSAIDNAVRWIAFKEKYFNQVVEESRADQETIKEIADVKIVCKMIKEQILLMQEALPEDKSEKYQVALDQVNSTLRNFSNLQSRARKSELK